MIPKAVFPLPRPPRSMRAVANEYLTMYPPQWSATLVRTAHAAARLAPVKTAPVRSRDGRPAPQSGRLRQCDAPSRDTAPVATRPPRPFAPGLPPLAVALLAGLGAWAVARAFPRLGLRSTGLPVIAVAFGLLGAGCSLLGVVAFRRARTTVNPLQPDAVTALVVSGVYGFTRNPMYLGFLLGLLAEIVWLGNPAALLLVPVFIVYLNRFQIASEEHALRSRFGPEFIAYAARVPRWL